MVPHFSNLLTDCSYLTSGSCAETVMKMNWTCSSLPEASSCSSGPVSSAVCLPRPWSGPQSPNMLWSKAFWLKSLLIWEKYWFSPSKCPICIFSPPTSSNMILVFASQILLHPDINQFFKSLSQIIFTITDYPKVLNSKGLTFWKRLLLQDQHLWFPS